MILFRAGELLHADIWEGHLVSWDAVVFNARYHLSDDFLPCRVHSCLLLATLFRPPFKNTHKTLLICKTRFGLSLTLNSSAVGITFTWQIFSVCFYIFKAESGFGKLIDLNFSEFEVELEI